MHRFVSVIAIVCAAAVTGFALASNGPTIVKSGQERWTAGTSLMKGTQLAALAGNLRKPGLFVLRMKMPPGTIYRPHFHYDTENLTVVSGTLWVGVGDRVDKSTMTALPAGSFVQVPARLHHYVTTKATTVIDVTAFGPQTMTLVRKPGGLVSASMAPAVVMSGQEHWTAGTGLMKGNQVAVLAGNPAKAGLFIVRLKLPAGTVFRPHYHTQIEDLTVVSGTLWAGVGDKVNAAKMTALPAGSFMQIPAGLHHYVMAREPTIIELTAMGPLSLIEVKP